jgi:hypothetical protein
MEVAMKKSAMANRTAKEITEARKALVECVRQQPDRWWFAYELKDYARNGWRPGVMNMALRRLRDADVFESEGDRIRLRR